MRGFNCFMAALFLVLFSVAAVYSKGLDYGIEESFVNIHGLISLEYFDFDGKGKNGGVSSFDQSATYLLFDTKIQNNLKGIIEVKLDHGGERVKIDRCFMDYGITKNFSFKAGKFYMPFHYDVKEFRPTGNKLITSPLPEIIDYDMFRDLGVELKTDFKYANMPFCLQTAVSNGAFRNKYDANKETGIESSIDTNDNKLFTAKFSVSPIEILDFSASYMEGTVPMQIFNTTNSLLTPLNSPTLPLAYTGEGYDNITYLIDMGNLDCRFQTVSLTAHKSGWDLRGWFTEGWIRSQKTYLSSSYLMAYMLQGSYQLLKDKYVKSLELVARRRHFEIDTRKITIATGNDEKWNQDSIGLNAKIAEHLTFKVEGLMAKEDATPSGKDNGILCQFMIDF